MTFNPDMRGGFSSGGGGGGANANALAWAN